MSAEWDSFVKSAADHAYATMDSEPEALLDGDGYPSVEADFYIARLLGFDDQVVDQWTLPRIEPDLRLPIRPNYRITDPTDASIRTARYVCQSRYATLSVVPAAVLPPKPAKNPDHLTRLCFLRYRRRS